jgi:hypothetical protein
VFWSTPDVAGILSVLRARMNAFSNVNDRSPDSAQASAMTAQRESKKFPTLRLRTAGALITTAGQTLLDIENTGVIRQLVDP